MKQIPIIFLFLITISSIFFSFYHLERLTPFGWDQARDAQVMWQIVHDGKLTLIGPGVVGPDSFFLGPLWYYLMVPFFFLSGLDPIGASIFGAIVGVATTILIYFITKDMFGLRTAAVTGIIWSTFFSRRVWNPILIPLCSILLIYLLIKVSKGEKKMIPLVLLLFGLSLQVHFQAIAFLIPIAIAIYFCLRKIKVLPIKHIAVGILSASITFIPIFVFDLRHNFINITTFIKFFGLTNGAESLNQFNLFANLISSFAKFLNYVWGLFPELSFIKPAYLGLSILIISIFSIIYSKIDKQSKVILLSFIIPPFLLFSLYKGGLSEYYFVLTWVSIIIGLVFFLIRIYDTSILGRCVITLVLVIFILFRFVSLLQEKNLGGLYYQKKAVSYIINQKIDPVFNVSYDVPVSEDLGYKYLFKLFGHEPQNIPQGHLWTIVVPASRENIKAPTVFGEIGVIRR